MMHGHMNIKFFWNSLFYQLVNSCWCFGGSECLHFEGHIVYKSSWSCRSRSKKSKNAAWSWRWRFLQNPGHCLTVDIKYYSKRLNLQQFHSEGLESHNMKMTNNFFCGTPLCSESWHAVVFWIMVCCCVQNHGVLLCSESWHSVMFWIMACCCVLNHCSNPFVFCQLQLLSFHTILTVETNKS